MLRHWTVYYSCENHLLNMGPQESRQRNVNTATGRYVFIEYLYITHSIFYTYH